MKFPSDILEGVDVHNLVLRIDYMGDIGNAFIEGKLVHDYFYNGTTWEIGFRNLEPMLAKEEWFILITPLIRNERGQHYVPTGMAFRPGSEGEPLAVIENISVVPEYKIPIELIPTS